MRRRAEHDGRPRVGAWERARDVDRLRHVPIASKAMMLEPYRDDPTGDHARAMVAWAASSAGDPDRARKLHATWHREYLDRGDQVRWLIRDYENRIVGTTELREIEIESGSIARKGRLLVDDRAPNREAIVLDAEREVLSIALLRLRLDHPVARAPSSDAELLTIHARAGFRRLGWDEAQEDGEIEAMVVEILRAADYRPDHLAPPPPRKRLGRRAC